MNTVLANNQGELIVPVIVTGTFQHPLVAPDVQQLARMKLQNLLPTSKNPGALTNGILGAILGQGQSANGNGGTTNDAVSGVLGALGGNKQQKQQKTSPQNAAQPDDSANQDQSDNPLGDMLNQVLNKKKKQQPPPSQPPKL